MYPYPDIKEQAVRFNRARSNLLLVIAFTIINIVLAAVDSEVFFLFSATVPSLVLAIARELSFDFGSGFMVAGVFIAFICVAVYFISWLLSKRWRGLILLALIFFIIDTILFAGIVALGAMVSGNIFDFSFIVQVAFVIWILFYLITGTVAWAKLRNINPMMIEAAAREAEAHAAQAETRDALNNLKGPSEGAVPPYIWNSPEALQDNLNAPEAPQDNWNTQEAPPNAWDAPEESPNDNINN